MPKPLGYWCPSMPDGPLIPLHALSDPCGGDVLVWAEESDDQSEAAATAPAPQPDPDPIVAERNAFKEKLKSINFGRVPGGARD